MDGDGLDTLDVFVRHRAAALLRYGYVLTGNPHDAADLVQEALARLGGRWRRVAGRGDPEAYVRTTMARLHISRRRRLRRERLVASPPERGYAEAELARIDGDIGLWHALAELPSRQRAVLVLRYHEQRSDEEIAAVLGQVYWSRHRNHQAVALFRAPLAGGRIQQVPGSRGYTLLRTPGWARTGDGREPSTRVWNYVDGTRWDARSDDFMEFECSPAWCVGRASLDTPPVARPSDGDGDLRPDFPARAVATTNPNIVICDLEYPVERRASRIVWDLRTGVLGIAGRENLDPSVSGATSMPSWLNEDGTITVLDPRAIP